MSCCGKPAPRTLKSRLASRKKRVEESFDTESESCTTTSSSDVTTDSSTETCSSDCTSDSEETSSDEWEDELEPRRRRGKGKSKANQAKPLRRNQVVKKTPNTVKRASRKKPAKHSKRSSFTESCSCSECDCDSSEEECCYNPRKARV